ncbi:MAG: 4-(cytidine 5'-diphospho)-2-C-methyl-D-erythritol kinase [Pseudomonadota bacterium]
MRYLAPAKLNLFLHITGRRADGFHDLETVFQLVDLFDELQIDSRMDGRIVREPPPSDPVLAHLLDEQDLSWRAARLLQQASATAMGANIHINKLIPSGGGLGGGSSDAATVLLALNEQWGLSWSRQRLADLGLQLGSDVPVFVHGHSAWAAGRGERLVPVDLPTHWYLIVDPGVAVKTAEIFADAQLTRDTPPSRIAAVPADGGRNDCEQVVRRRYPQVAKALDWLAVRANARLTGTGACLFAQCDSMESAQYMATQLPGQWKGLVVKGINQAAI